MRSGRAVAVGAVALVLTACAMTVPVGQPTTQSRTVAGFDRVSISGPGRLEITQTGEESLTVEADARLLPSLTSEVRGGTLWLGSRGMLMVVAREPVYRLTVAQLGEITVSGSADVRADPLDTPGLSTRISGSGSVRAAGEARELDVVVSGSGSFDGGGLKSSTARATITGSGDAAVWATRTLDVTISGSGSLTYRGEPRITPHISGSGTLHSA